MVDDGIRKLKEEYNGLLLRHYKAVVYLDNPDVSLDDKLYYQPQFEKLLDRLNAILNELNRMGIWCLPNQILGGFYIEHKKSRENTSGDVEDNQLTFETCC